MVKEFKTRNGKPATIARLDFHDWNGNLISRTRATTSEKEKGVMMIDNLADKFSLSENELNEIRKQIRDKSVEEMKSLQEQAKTNSGNVNWTRDENGRIISPFSPRKKN